MRSWIRYQCWQREGEPHRGGCSQKRRGGGSHHLQGPAEQQQTEEQFDIPRSFCGQALWGLRGGGREERSPPSGRACPRPTAFWDSRRLGIGITPPAPAPQPQQ
eukprot:CAMPEP_0174325408 /NCGR_PEP_ID=MMETSP0810-20121108/13227_1 /TAXON_ID=73025 ORGANISM="Eutreptiella gymnastica-like, Strain CCMP1594" /NCGR_SAMPLE_ID=MMETSP0810 /ASSEMBLY_ACC=CAM_ASM_000659 /LENGTH=103 /DNA_ID=CAMNT_0015438705 /DNA_START=1061 /DNA_END=1369 /DNA_ORIENTATION=-